MTRLVHILPWLDDCAGSHGRKFYVDLLTPTFRFLFVHAPCSFHLSLGRTSSTIYLANRIGVPLRCVAAEFSVSNLLVCAMADNAQKVKKCGI